MNKKLILIIGAIAAFIIGAIVILGILSTPKTNWKVYYKKENKHPFGLYIFYQELKQITEAKSVTEVTHLDQLKNLNPNNDIILYIDENNQSSNKVLKAIDNLNKKPFKIFYASTDFYTYIEVEQYPKMIAIYNKDTLHINKNKYIDTINYSKNPDIYKKLGYIDVKGKKYPNYYIIKNNKMLEFTHAQPLFFTNLFLLEKDGYQYTKEIFKPFRGKNIYWINPSRNYLENADSNSPLSYILSQKELRSAWYIILVALGFYLIFKSKREQKIIPIVEPEKNLTLEFTNAIASMYYESGNPSDIIKKQIDYFFYRLRKQYHVKTENIEDEHLIYTLAQKAQISEAEIIDFLNELKSLYNKPKSILKDVNRTHQIIENYKKKAHLL